VPEDATGVAAFGYSNFTFESILVADPDVIFFSGYNEDRSLNEEAIEALEANELWQELTAVQNERVYLIEPWVWRGGRGLTLMARTLDEAMPALYPDVFPEPLAFETDTDETSEDDTEADE
ncbi:MAG: ABC transporter substrate-binding protein, partial [Phototrophicaceae bacterium]